VTLLPVRVMETVGGVAELANSLRATTLWFVVGSFALSQAAATKLPRQAIRGSLASAAELSGSGAGRSTSLMKNVFPTGSP